MGSYLIRGGAAEYIFSFSFHSDPVEMGITVFMWPMDNLSVFQIKNLPSIILLVKGR